MTDSTDIRTDTPDTDTCSQEAEDAASEETVFRFKRFSVINRRSAMKVNTDGVLLGAAMSLSGKERRLLDIGTGTGTIALMAAQRLSELTGNHNPASADFRITGIDIDEDSAAEADENFRRSDWKDTLAAVHASLKDFEMSIEDSFSAEGNTSGKAGARFDMIFSNPPYYGGDLKAPDPRRCHARHSESLSWGDIITFAQKYLSKDGRLALILPSEERTALTRTAAADGLYLSRLINIKTVPRKKPKRILTEFSRKRPGTLQEETISIQEAGTWSEDYRSLLSNFLTSL